MSVFRAILFAAVVAGAVVGLVDTVVQRLGTVPLIAKAEVYERAADEAAAKSLTPSEHAAHARSEEAWEPQEGFERTAFTAVANILTATGFALVLCGMFALRGTIDWYDGLLWGLAGFVIFTIAPGLGLPPTLPGVPAADLGARQLWWIATAASTAAGLGLLFFRRSPLTATIAVCLFALPHIVGPPQLADVHTNVPQTLSRQFVAAVTCTSLLFWSLLGSLSSLAYRRFSAT